MLSSSNRLTSPEDFRHTVRRGRRAAGPLLVLHVTAPHVDKATNTCPRVGFVVAKSVGPAVVRNQVKRRLRHVMRERVDTLPIGSLLVLRALPGSAHATSGDLAAEVDRCLLRAGGVD